MKLYKSDKVRFIAGLILIGIIYSLFYIYFLENKDVAALSGFLRHGISFGATLTVYFIGTSHLGTLEDKWMSSLWHFVHISGLIILTGLGLFDLFIADISFNMRRFALTILEFLISPVLYVGMGLLNRSLKQQSAS
jgi:hypothetical protein